MLKSVKLNRKAFAFLLVLFALVFAGCLDWLNGSASVNLQGGVVNVSGSLGVNGNASFNASGVQQGVLSVIPSNLSACFYGNENERFSGNFFGNFSAMGKTVFIQSKWVNASTSNDSFAGCAVIVLLDDDEGRYLERAEREKVSRELAKGAGLIVIGEGGALSQLDGSIYGWDAGMAGVVPAIITGPGKDAMPLGRHVLSGIFAPTKTDPAFNGIGRFHFDGWQVVEALPVRGSDVIATAKEREEPSSPSYPAIIRLNTPLRNTAYYFSYNVLDTPQVLFNAVRFQSQQYLYLFFLRAGR